MERTTLHTTIGPILIEGDEEGVRRIHIGAPGAGEYDPPSPSSPVWEAAEQLRQYFSGERTAFELRLSPQGTEFQRRVWRELERIPYGKTISYGELARRLGNPNASRAVGSANGANPLPIVVPCHRVIGANGSLTGFTAGVGVKAKLLEHEGFLPDGQREMF